MTKTNKNDPVPVLFWPGEYVVLSKEDWASVEAVLDRARQEFGPLNLKLTQTSLTVPTDVEESDQVELTVNDLVTPETELISKFQALYGGSGLIATQLGDDGEVIAHVEKPVEDLPQEFEGRPVVIQGPSTHGLRRFWVSWKEPVDETGDYRPMSWPLPDSIPSFWCSGEGDGYVTLCAVVDAHSEAEVMDIVGRYWKPSGWRFVTEKNPEWRPQSDRFPWPEWSGE